MKSTSMTASGNGFRSLILLLMQPPQAAGIDDSGPAMGVITARAAREREGPRTNQCLGLEETVLSNYQQEELA